MKYNREKFLRDLASILHHLHLSVMHLSALVELALEGIILRTVKFVFETKGESVPWVPVGFDGYGLLDSTVITDMTSDFIPNCIN